MSYEFSKSASWVQNRGGVRTAFVAKIVLERYLDVVLRVLAILTGRPLAQPTGKRKTKEAETDRLK